MYVVFFFLGYLFLALTLPLGWSLIPLWRRASHARQVSCPAGANSATVRLDACFAVKMHALGNPELRVQDCSQWPRLAGCNRACLAEIRG